MGYGEFWKKVFDTLWLDKSGMALIFDGLMVKVLVQFRVFMYGAEFQETLGKIMWTLRAVSVDSESVYIAKDRSDSWADQPSVTILIASWHVLYQKLDLQQAANVASFCLLICSV